MPTSLEFDPMSAAAKPVPAPNSRVRALVFPREHGAWGMLLVPLITGAAAGLDGSGNWTSLALFTTAALALFWLRTPLETALGSSPMRAQSAMETNWLLLAIGALGSLAMFCVVLLLWHGGNRQLLTLGAVAALALAVQAVVKKLGRAGRMPAQIIGALGLAATAPAAFYVVTGHLGLRAVGLWFANWLFAGNQIHFVQLRIHAARAASLSDKFARGQFFLAGQLAMVVALMLGGRYHLLPWLTVVAFLPVLVRGLLWFRPGLQPLMVKRLGWSELAHAIAFGLLLIAAFRL
ncbi:MAG: YwiC-like family protein [Terriglobales bacterium]